MHKHCGYLKKFFRIGDLGEESGYIAAVAGSDTARLPIICDKYR